MSLRYCCFFFPSPDLCCMWWLTRDEVKCFFVSAVSVNRPATTLTYDSSLIQVFYEFKQQRVCVCVCAYAGLSWPQRKNKNVSGKNVRLPVCCVSNLPRSCITVCRIRCMTSTLLDCAFFFLLRRGARDFLFFKVCCRVYEQRNKKGTIRLVEVSTRDTVCFIRALYVPSPSG